MIEVLSRVASADHFPLVLGVLIATGMIIGGVMRENGWGYRSLLIWLLSAVIYTVAVLFGFWVNNVAVDTADEWMGVLVVIGLTAVCYLGGIMIGVGLINRSKTQMAGNLADIEEFIGEVISGERH